MPTGLFAVRSLSAVVAIGLVAVSINDAHGQVTRPCVTDLQAPVPAFVLRAATSGTLADFASALAEAGVCAGLVVADAEAGDVTNAWRFEPREPKATLDDAIRTVQRRHVALTIEPNATIESKAFVLLRDRRVDARSSPLTRTLPRFEVQDVRADEAFRRAVDAVAPGSAPGGGFVGSYLSRPDEPPATIDDLEGPVVGTVLTEPTFLDVLVDIGSKSPGVVWLLRMPVADAGREPTYQMMLFCRRGTHRALGSAFR